LLDIGQLGAVEPATADDLLGFDSNKVASVIGTDFTARAHRDLPRAEAAGRQVRLREEHCAAVDADTTQAKT
jgi:hypothetical protein